MKRTPIKRANTSRRTEKHVRNFDGGIAHDDWVRERPCTVCVRLGARQKSLTQAAHVKARGMGGCNSGWWAIVPLCNAHHREQEALGNVVMAERYGVSFELTAKALTRSHLEELGAI